MDADNTNNSIINKYNELYSKSDIEKLNSFSKKTPKFSLQNLYKICKVVDVYDGDTIKVVFEHNGEYNKWTIRMYGYDSPEMRPSKKLENRDEIKKKAIESKEYLKSLVLNKPILLHCLDFDKYGRILGNIYTENYGDKCINDHMIEMNYGYPYFGGTKK